MNETECCAAEIGIIRRLLRALEEGLTTMPLVLHTELPNPTGMFVSAAAIARCHALVDGMLVLHSESHRLLMGALLRPLYEVWLTGLYSLVGGLDADEVLLAARDFRLGPLRHVMGWPEDPPLPAGKHLSVKKLAERVHELVEDQDYFAPFYDALHLYQRLYALDSYDSVHGGIGIISPHLVVSGDSEDGSVSIVLRPDDGGVGCTRLTLAALLTIDLARPVWRLGGVGDEALVRLDGELRAANRTAFYGHSSGSGLKDS